MTCSVGKNSKTIFISFSIAWSPRDSGTNPFLSYGTDFVLFLAVLENSVLPMGWDSSHATLIVTSEL